MRHAGRWLVLATGLVLVAAGAVLFLATDHSAGRGGWFAYAPLSDSPAYQSELQLSFDDRWTVLWTGRLLAGAGLACLGLLVVVGQACWLLGRRAASRPAAPPTAPPTADPAAGPAV
jgi:uncharacterized membrane protein HdeD (DUF308 family)